MNRNYNSQAFTPEQVGNGELQDLLNYLINFNAKSEKSYMDIHICSDGYCQIVEWSEIHYDFQYECGKFQFVDGDQVVMTEKTFPDNHTELCYSEDDYKERLDEFLKDNPGWVVGPYGNWTNEIENKKFREMYLSSESKESDKDAED